MGSGKAKQFLDLDGDPILAVTLRPFQQCTAVQSVILVVPEAEVESCKEGIVGEYGFTKVEQILAGGPRRQDSVRIGIEASMGNYELVLIHDGVRPIIGLDLIARVVEAARTYRAVTTALPSKETVKEVDGKGIISRTRERKRIWLAQTPQIFRYGDILKAHRRAAREAWEDATDDAFLLEKMGIPVKVMEGSEDNIKVTTPHDLELARALLRMRSAK
jgi:2-C-methyl-D-erythritol 4-phosphate cytidylyltransferase